MKSLNTNSLRKALAPQATAPHPDADLLNGFAEGALLADERRRVVDHLTGCDACRAVIALASDAAPALEAKSAPARTGRLFLRMAIPAFSAATIIAATLVVLDHARRPALDAAQRQAAVAVQSTVVPVSQISVNNTAPAGLTAPAQKSHEPASNGAASLKALDSTHRAAPPGLPSAPTAAQTELVPVPARQTVVVSADISANRVSAPAPAAQSFGNEADAGPHMSTSAFANTVTTQALAKAASTPMARPHWRINRQGQPERAFGSGAWQAVLPAAAPLMRVLATAGTDVWVGGDNAQLYHSSDNGQTWSRIALPEKNGSMHTLAHIQIESQNEITIRASDGTTWTTSNDGASWK